MAAVTKDILLRQVDGLRDLARRFGDLHEPRMHVRISAPGHPGVIIAPERIPAERETVVRKSL